MEVFFCAHGPQIHTIDLRTNIFEVSSYDFSVQQNNGVLLTQFLKKSDTKLCNPRRDSSCPISCADSASRPFDNSDRTFGTCVTATNINILAISGGMTTQNKTISTSNGPLQHTVVALLGGR